MSSQGPPWHSRPLGWHLTNDGASCQHSLHQYVTVLSWPISSSTSFACSSIWHVPVGLILRKIPRQRALKIGNRSFISAWLFLGLQSGVMLVNCTVAPDTDSSKLEAQLLRHENFLQTLRRSWKDRVHTFRWLIKARPP